MTATVSHRLTIDETQTLNEIVALYPQTLAVLQDFGLDMCCGGALPLRTAVEHHALDLGNVMAVLHAAVEDTPR